MKTIKKLLDLLTQQERKRASLLMCMVLLMALLDVIGVASIMPFMAVLANPELVETNAILNAAYTKLGFDDPQQFLFALGLLVFVVLLVSLAFKALTTYAQLRFTSMREFSLGKRLVEGYLHQPYSWFLGRHSADLGKTILSEVEQVINNAIKPMMTLIAQGAVVTALLILLIWIEPMLAVLVGLSLATAYGLIFKSTRGFLTRIGKERFKVNQERFKAVSEAFNATKEIKVGGLEKIYTNRFSVPAQIYARHQAASQVISQLPRYALEAIAFGGMLLVVLYLMALSGSFADALPIIALYSFAGYRLMPALQQIYGSLTQLRFATPALEALHHDLISLQAMQVKNNDEKMQLLNCISLKNIKYGYPNADEPALKKLSLTIPACSMVGFVGVSGSGKSTTVDLILGLLEAQEGEFEVDGKKITGHNRRSWQNTIGYVPQQIYLTDATVAANIAFGIDDEFIDQAAVERAAKVANLHEFIINELPEKYLTKIGERGVRLSGGQRQRIGIARALYHEPNVLILDEATSALDNITEKTVMDSIKNLGHKITIILIAHRLSTIKECDCIFLLESGSLKAEGKFKDLLDNDLAFKTMVGSN